MGKKKKLDDMTPDELAQEQEVADDHVCVGCKVKTDEDGYVITSDQAGEIGRLRARVADLEKRLSAVGASTAEGPIVCGVCKRQLKPGEKAHMTPKSTVVKCQACMKCFACGRPLVDRLNRLRDDATPITPNADGFPHCRDCALRLSL